MVFRCHNSQNQTMKRNWSDIEPHWMRLSERTAFDLSAECVVIDQQNEVMETTLSGLPTFLKASAAMSNPLVKQFIALAKKSGAEIAMHRMLMQAGEEFAQLWKEAQSDLQGGAFTTMDDLVEAVATARKGYDELPRRILVIQVNQRDCDVLLVGPPDNEESDSFAL
ncbi:MAG: hypothetical protein CL859_01255 [Cyanobium sp. ARS6]|nr:hypothetical protein [Cyanobium sp. ARS6]